MHRLVAAITGLFLCCATLTGCAGTPLDGVWMLEHRELPDGTIVEPPEVTGYMTFRDGVRSATMHWTGADGEHSINSVSVYDLAKYEYAERNLYYAYTVAGVETVFNRDDAVEAREVVYTERGLRFQLPLHNEPIIEVGDDRLTATMPDTWVDHWVRVKVVEPAGGDGATPGTLQPADAAQDEAENAAEDAAEGADESAPMESEEPAATAEPEK